MQDSYWRARIDSSEGQTLGAGVLVDSTRILTCAHVVRERVVFKVTFPGIHDDLPATLALKGPWEHQGDVGDIAVIQLLHPVDIAPARIAPLESLRNLGGRKLRAQGFRYGHEEAGLYVTLRTSEDRLLSNEWLQAEVIADHLEHLGEGFSGSAAYFSDGGEVVGIVTDADLERGGSIGRILPVSVIGRYWEEFDDLLPLPWLSASDWHSLRLIVHKAKTEPSLRQIYAIAFPEMLRTPPFPSVWNAIRYVAEEQLGETRLAHFLTTLTRHVPSDVSRQLSAWINRVLAPHGPSRAGPESPSSIIIRLERKTHGNAYTLTMSTLIDGEQGPGINPVEVRSEGEARRHIEQHMPSLVGVVLDRDWLIEFALPESWFGKPYEEWFIDKENGIHMRSYPVVIRDVQRLRPAVRRDLAAKRWRTLRSRGAGLPQPIRCAHEHNRTEFQAWLEANEEICILVYASRPERGRVTGALNVGMPIMLWRRGSCQEMTHDDCEGSYFLHQFSEIVEKTHPDELPVAVWKLRKQAAAPPPHEYGWVRDVVLLWDDPARMPDPPLAMGK
jgi:vWA-MoxR associated protein C-terminal domain/vWA-MoxR associated protein middle region (VMAP-M) 8/Trypsin-like peptidase domain